MQNIGAASELSKQERNGRFNHTSNKEDWLLSATAVHTVQRKLFLATDTDVATIPTVQMRRHTPRDKELSWGTRLMTDPARN